MVNPVYRTPAWQALRLRVLERDGFRCQIRRPGCLGAATAADHIIELQDGGEPYDLANVQAACRPCNSAKRNERYAERVRRRQVRQW